MTNSAPSARPSATRRAGVWQAVLLLAGSCMPIMGAVLITPVLPQLSQEFGREPGAPVLVPMIVAIPALMIAICAPFAGQIVDRLGRKRLLIIAMFAYALVGTAPGWLTTLPAILVSRVLVGICEAAIMTVCTTLIVDYFHEKQRRNRYLSLQTVVTTLAATVFIALGGALGIGGWHAPFWVYGLAAVIAVPMLFSLWEPSRADRTDAHLAPGVRSRTPWHRLRFPVAISVLGGFTFYVFVIEASYLIVGAGVSATDTGVIGAVSASAALATAIGGLLFPRFARVRAQLVLAGAFALQAVGMVIVWAAPVSASIFIGAVIASFGSGVLLPGLLIWTVSRIEFEERGRATGLFLAAFYFGQFLTPLLMGGITAITGALPTSVGVVGVLAALLAALFGFGRFRGAGAPDAPAEPAERRLEAFEIS